MITKDIRESVQTYVGVLEDPVLDKYFKTFRDRLSKTYSICNSVKTFDLNNIISDAISSTHNLVELSNGLTHKEEIAKRLLERMYKIEDNHLNKDISSLNACEVSVDMLRTIIKNIKFNDYNGNNTNDLILMGTLVNDYAIDTIYKYCVDIVLEQINNIESLNIYLLWDINIFVTVIKIEDIYYDPIHSKLCIDYKISLNMDGGRYFDINLRGESSVERSDKDIIKGLNVITSNMDKQAKEYRDSLRYDNPKKCLDKQYNILQNRDQSHQYVNILMMKQLSLFIRNICAYAKINKDRSIRDIISEYDGLIELDYSYDSMTVFININTNGLEFHYEYKYDFDNK